MIGRSAGRGVVGLLEEAEWQTEVATQGIFTAKIQTAASLTASAVDTENNDHRPWVPSKKIFS